MRCPVLAVSSLLAAALLVAAPAGPALAADQSEVTVRGVGVALGETPVNVELDGAAFEPGRYALHGADSATIEGQVYRDGDRTFLAFVLPGLDADAERRYRMIAVDDDSRINGVSIDEEGRDLRVLIDGEQFTVYRADDAPKPYFYPLIGPTGFAIHAVVSDGRRRGRGPRPSAPAILLVHPRRRQRRRLLGLRPAQRAEPPLRQDRGGVAAGGRRRPGRRPDPHDRPLARPRREGPLHRRPPVADL